MQLLLMRGTVEIPTSLSRGAIKIPTLLSICEGDVIALIRAVQSLTSGVIVASSGNGAGVSSTIAPHKTYYLQRRLGVVEQLH